MPNDSIDTAVTKYQGALVEPRLTRTELVDLIIDESIADLDARLDELRKAEAKLEEKKRKLVLADVLPFVTAKSAELSFSRRWHRDREDKDDLDFTISGRIPAAKLPDWYVAQKKAEEDLQEKKSAVCEMRAKLKDGRARARSLVSRRILEGTAEGRALLEHVAELKKTIRAQLQEKTEG